MNDLVDAGVSSDPQSNRAEVAAIPEFLSQNRLAEIREACVLHRAKHAKSFFKKLGTRPLSMLEKLADEVFVTWCGETAPHHPDAGVEWWVHVKKATRDIKNATKNDDKDNGEDHGQHATGHEETGNSLAESIKTASIGFHWDRDEYGNDENHEMAVSDQLEPRCPHLGTVLYLTSFGAPTVVLNQPVINRGPIDDKKTGEKRIIDRGYVSYPVAGKQLSFKGDLLHGVPEEFKIGEKNATSMEDTCGSISADRELRVTFLANIWLDGRPHGVKELNEVEEGGRSSFQNDDWEQDDYREPPRLAQLKLQRVKDEYAVLCLGLDNPIAGGPFPMVLELPTVKDPIDYSPKW